MGGPPPTQAYQSTDGCVVGAARCVWRRRKELLKAEEEEIKRMCDTIISFKPDVVVTEKGLSDLAAHFFTKAGISAIRRLRKTDNNRIARACGATIVHRCAAPPAL